MSRILQKMLRILRKMFVWFCIVVSSFFLLIFLFIFITLAVGYICCVNKDALQKYAKEVNLTESARQELLMMKKYGRAYLDSAGRQEDGWYVYYHGGNVRYVRGRLHQDDEDKDVVVHNEERDKHQIEKNAVLNDEESDKHKAWKEKIKSISQYSAWKANYYNIRYHYIDEGVMVIPLSGMYGINSFLYICFNEDLTPAASPPPWIPSEGTLAKIEDGIYWRYSFWPMRG